MSAGIRVIISPAKQMLAGADDLPITDVPAHSYEATKIIQELATYADPKLQQLWKVSDRLFATCKPMLEDLIQDGIPQRKSEILGHAWTPRLSPAILAYSGIQYQSLAPGVLDDASLSWLDEHLRIISGLYGVLAPFDAVLPYRLEMGSGLAVGSARNLYEFWGDTLAYTVLHGEHAAVDVHDAACTDDEAGTRKPKAAEKTEPVELINLASVEYARAVLPHLSPGTPCTTCIFAELVQYGQPKQRARASKIARGSMVRWMAERGLNNTDELTEFCIGYRYAPELSSRDHKLNQTLVFVRDAA
ncbi:YaaA family protein [Collinsella sp. AGMB00827]|uniref:UPF0246 protein K6V98_08130 n=1 Tax=Collinsella ureilytica TaxID=2869515 RepID=A0ABS7MLR6_9ACTN|nr:YaaA family protein [Collinsella urealyticum]MBY4798312.1 YaaA family protein [Collinsella urealyticum]